MDPKNILIVGTKGSLIAFRRDNGQQLWSVHLKSNGFVNVATNETRVYAHTNGELFCVDLLTGTGVWNDPLKGFGYDLASIAGPGLFAPPATLAQQKRQEAAAASASTTHATTH
jgi:outer membrane protein assembly factor BamB